MDLKVKGAVYLVFKNDIKSLNPKLSRSNHFKNNSRTNSNACPIEMHHVVDIKFYRVLNVLRPFFQQNKLGALFI